MKKYLCYFRIIFTNGLQYRTAALAGCVTQFGWGLMTILMFRAFYRSDPGSIPMEMSQLCSYIWLQQAFLHMFATWYWDSDFFEMIRSGGIAYELSRPADIYGMMFSKQCAVRMSGAFLRCIPTLAAASLLPEGYRLSLPGSPADFILFLIAMPLGMFTVTAFTSLVYVAALYTVSSKGVQMAASTLADFFSGGLIPVTFFPSGLRIFAELTPFGAMENLPMRIYSGNITGTDAMMGIFLQLFWICVMVLIGKLWLSKALGRITVQGG